MSRFDDDPQYGADPTAPRYDSAGAVPVTAAPASSAPEGSGVLVARKWLISVYLDNGLVLEYDVASAAAAREHSAAIVASGYRSVSAGEPHVLNHFPAHRIVKVKVTAPEAIPTGYLDRVRGT